MLSEAYTITMFGGFPHPRHMPCTDCGASIAFTESNEHVCDAERLLDFRLFELRDEIAAFDSELTFWLGSAEGRFAVWLAEQTRR